MLSEPTVGHNFSSQPHLDAMVSCMLLVPTG